jgi:hypothetical protein
MKKPKPSADTGSHAYGLTLAQQSAVDLLVAGKNDTETAAALNLHRVTVTRWRLYSPEFRAALADRRAAVWGAAADRLRSLLPRALDALAKALDAGELEVAIAVLKLAGPLPLVPTDPTDPDEYVRRQVEQERERVRDRDDLMDGIRGLPETERHERTVRERLARLAGESETEGSPIV